MALAHVAGAGAAGLGTDSAGVQHRGGAERHGGSANLADQRNRAGHAVSGRAFCDAAGRRRYAVRHAGPGVHDRSFGRREERRGQCCRHVATARRAGEGRTDAGAGDYGALPARSQASRLHSEQPAASGGKRNRSTGGGQRVAGTGSQLHGARRVFGEARGSAGAGGGIDHREAGSGWDCGEGSDAEGYPVARGVCQGARNAAAERAGKRSHGRGDGLEAETGEDRGTGSRSDEGAADQAGRRRGAGARAAGEADAMQYTLPLKEKQIQQSKLEAEARKEATIQNAEAAAQAKVIDSKAETERRKLLADAEADRIRVTAAADAERMASEA